MKTLKRNQTVIWYALPTGNRTPILDGNGLMTGNTRIEYTAPQRMEVSLSESIGLNNLSAQGVADPNPYGLTTNYTHRMVTEDMDCPITEETLIWHNRDPGNDAYSVPHNFKVIRIGRSVNFKNYYLRQVYVNAPEAGGTP